MRRALILFGVLAVASIPAIGQDPAKVAAKQCTVAFENDYVRVLHWTLTPHDKIPMHEHPALVAVSLSAGKTVYTLADGKTKEVATKNGQASWNEPEKHSSEYMGTVKGESFQVELKQKPTAAMTSISPAEDSVKVDPKHYHVEFENDRVRVLRIKYGPNEKSVMHAHPANVAVFLSAGTTKFTRPDKTSNVTIIKAGQVQWGDKEQHLPENIGNKPFELILVELK